jgi:type I restriction enzyme S subunit
VDADYLSHVLANPASVEWFKFHAIGATMPNLNEGIIRSFPLAIPPLPERRRIAAILGALDDKIDLNRRMNRTLEDMAQALFKSWFLDFDGHTDLVDSELGMIPRGWRVSEIGSVVKVVGGSTPSTANPLFWEGGVHYWTTPKDLSAATSPLLLNTERLITDAGVASISSGLLPAGTFLLSSRAPIGYTAIARMPVAINQGYIAIPPGGPLSGLFLLHWVRVNLDVIKSRAGGTTFQEISKSNFRPILVAVPPVGSLRRFDEEVGPLFDRIEVNERQTATLAALRDTLLPKLISGEVRVPEAEQAVMEAT